MKAPILLAGLCAAFCGMSSAQENDRVPLYFVDTDVQEVAKFHEKLTGSKVVAEGVSGKISIFAGALTKAGRIEVIEETLFAAGFKLIEPQSGTIRILPRLAPVPQEELPVVTDATKLPDRERVVTYVYPVRTRNPAEFADSLWFIFPELGGRIVTIVPDKKEKTLRITARTTAIHKVLKVITELDPPAMK